MCKDAHNFAIPGGNASQVLDNLIDKSPKHLISKITMEEKLFHAWHHQQTVLIGDGECCGAMHPIAGLGAVNEMQDAVTLANWLNILPAGPNLQEVEKCFQECRYEPYPLACKAFCQSEGVSPNASTHATKIPLAQLQLIRTSHPFRAIYLNPSLHGPRSWGSRTGPRSRSFPWSRSDRGTIKPLPQRRLFKTKQIILERAKALVADHKPEISLFINC
ncbi:hypothetical protein BG003_005775 [Podila horticola]|nr:hypothetical protein BG003_005775 [Podila horticola]